MAAQQPARRKTPMVQKYKMHLELEFPEEVNVTGEILMETVVDAIFDYDSRNRLILGEPLPTRGERLIGTARVGTLGSSFGAPPLSGHGD